VKKLIVAKRIYLPPTAHGLLRLTDGVVYARNPLPFASVLYSLPLELF